jgi:hypothetical protein
LGNLKVVDFTDTMKGMTVCKCGSHAFLIEAFPEDGLAEIAMWRCGTPTFTWRNRASAIWKILTTGYPYVDQIMLDKSGVGNLIRHLSVLHRKL